jgi:hypothetical protein
MLSRFYKNQYSADIEGVNIVEKKNGDVVISRFAFLQIREESASLSKLLRENGREWDGSAIEVKQAKESFRERAAKLRQEKKEVENTENFQAPFQAAKFENDSSSSSSSEDSSSSDEDEAENKMNKLAEASKLLQQKLSQRKAKFRRNEILTLSLNFFFGKIKMANFSENISKT